MAANSGVVLLPFQHGNHFFGCRRADDLALLQAIQQSRHFAGRADADSEAAILRNGARGAIAGSLLELSAVASDFSQRPGLLQAEFLDEGIYRVRREPVEQ